MNSASANYSPALLSCIMLTKGYSTLEHYAALKGLSLALPVRPAYSDSIQGSQYQGPY